MKIRAFVPADTEAVVELWEECGLTRPWNDPLQDIARKLTVQPELFLVGVEPVEADFDSAVRPEHAASDSASGRDGHVFPGGGKAGRIAPQPEDSRQTTSDAGNAGRTTSEPNYPPAPQVIASAMIGFDGHRGWVNYLAVSPAWRGRGYARTLMGEAERLLTALGCPKLNLQVRDDNLEAIAFYRALGYEPDHAIAFGKRLIAD